MNFEISNIQIIEEEYLDKFVFKKEISEVETYGLEMCLIKLLLDAGYDRDRAYGLVDSFTRHLKDCLDVLDGCYDIIEIGEYKVLAVHLTENGIPILKCLRDECDYYDSDDSLYYATIG